jgi:hypothetical protein
LAPRSSTCALPRASAWAPRPSTCASRVKSSQVNTLPKAKSQAKDKRAKDRQ